MGLTPGEFFRALPLSVEGLDYRVEDNTITIDHPEGKIVIHLTPSAGRRIGALLLPVTHVKFIFSGLDKLERAHFMDNLDLHFQRGGG
jgi:hypothetical protein